MKKGKNEVIKNRNRFIKPAAILTAVLIAAMTMLSGCGDSPTNPETPDGTETGSSLTFTPETLPKIDGATALVPYYEAMAAKFLGMDVEEASQYVLCTNTTGAYEKLINKSVDIIFCALPSDEQKQMAADAGVEFEMTPFLNGGFVFFVSKDNPIESLTVEQLHDIYAGKITNWKEVGGDDMEIIAYQRPDNSGSQTGLYRYIIPKEETMEAPTEKVIAEMAGIIDAVAAYENSEASIGYSYYYYVANMHTSDKIKLIAIDGIAPTDDTIAAGEYPLINNSMAIIRKDTPADSPVRDIIKWLLSDEGQATAVENGYVPKKE